MLTPEASTKALRRLFRRFRVADLATLYETLDTGSRMSVFRRLWPLGYLSSFTHCGRYYTLGEVVQFDEYGLWFHQGIGFSRAGTLKSTIVELVDSAVCGLTHQELERLVHVRVHNSLLALVREGRVGREPVAGVFLYVSAHREQRTSQVGRREEEQARGALSAPVLTETTTIQVLVQTIHAGRQGIVPARVVKRLAARGVGVSIAQVEQVYAQYGIEAGKKTAG